MRNRTALLCAAVFLAVAAMLSGCRQTASPTEHRPESEPSGSGKEPAAGPGTVRLSLNQVQQFGIVTASAAAGLLRVEVELPGEVALNADRVAHVVPRVTGIVREVRKNLGDPVRRGEIMAVLDSRELADLISGILSARERFALAQNNFAREERVWAKKISSEQDYYQAKNSLAEANIDLRNAEQRVRTLGFSDEFISQIPTRPDKGITLYEIAAPFDATVIEKHISLGEVLKDDSPAFLIADLSTVWVNLDVHQKDLPLIRIGQPVEIVIGNSVASAAGHVAFLDPMATETNRTIHARIVLPNPEGKLRPGLFVNGRVTVDKVRIPVLVPNDAIVMIDGKACVFLSENGGFRLQPVATGRTNGAETEITAGLAAGRSFAAKGAFTLKSELQKPEAEK
jgi:cobalt-zinc-cadmium efflux system membrane fusion protein